MSFLELDVLFIDADKKRFIQINRIVLGLR